MESGNELRWGIDRNEIPEKGLPRASVVLPMQRVWSRQKAPEFSKYVKTLFEFLEAKIIVAFKGKELVAFETSCLVDNVLVLLGMVHSERGLQRRTPDLIQHLYRQTARHTPEIKFIYDEMVSRAYPAHFSFSPCEFLSVEIRRVSGYAMAENIRLLNCAASLRLSGDSKRGEAREDAGASNGGKATDGLTAPKAQAARTAEIIRRAVVFAKPRKLIFIL